MSLSDLPDLPALAVGAGLWFGLLCLCARTRADRGVCTLVKTCAGILTVLAVFVPVNEVALWSRVFSFYPNPSLPMLGLMCAGLWERLFGLVVFRRADWLGIWIFGSVAGTVLYLHPMLIGSLDLYYWGWDRTGATLTLAALAVMLLACGHRLGVLLLAALIGYALGALESRNCWDYVVDPFYWLISAVVLAAQTGITLSRRLGRVALPVTAMAPLPVRSEESVPSLTSAGAPAENSRRL